MSKRSVGVDFGSRRIGIAICDAGGLVATPHETIKRVGDETIEHAKILAIAAEIDATALVVGLPIDLKGEEGPAARNVRSEVRRLAAKTSLDVHLHDERLTTVSADRSLTEQGVRRADRRDMVDQLAAATLLQSWLDGLGGGDAT